MHEAKTFPFSAEVMAAMEKKGPEAWVVVENLVRTCLFMEQLPVPTKPAQPINRERPRLRLVSSQGRRHA